MPDGGAAGAPEVAAGTAALLSRAQLRERIERLAALRRPPGSEGEAQAADVLAAELEGLGLRVRCEHERVHGTYWWPIGLPLGAAALTGWFGGRGAAAAVGAAAAALNADDVRIGPRFTRRALPKRTTTNVIAEAGPEDAARTVLLVAHYDAAHTGLVFHPEAARAFGRRFPELYAKAMTTPPTMWGAVAFPALVALGALTGRARLRRAGAWLSAAYAAALADIAVRRVVPGANDNLSGVAALLSLAHAYAAESPPGDTRVILLFTGAEESFMEGMVGFAKRNFAALDPATTTVFCLDTVGSPTLLALEGEGMLGIAEYPKDLIAVIHDCAEDLGIDVLKGLRFRNATDGVVALRAGYRTAMLGSADEFKVPTHYHWPTDTPDNVDYGTVADAARLCHAVIAREAA
jgi:putative aminopeptidase FrvX